MASISQQASKQLGQTRSSPSESEALINRILRMSDVRGDRTKMRVALFGLSANPPTGHTGHRGIVEYLRDLAVFDAIYVLPVFQHIYNTKAHMLPFEHRYEMCMANFLDLNETNSASVTRVEVSRLEEECADALSPPHANIRLGTIDLVDYAIEKYFPADMYELHWVLGMDTFLDILNGRWKQAERSVCK